MNFACIQLAYVLAGLIDGEELPLGYDDVPACRSRKENFLPTSAGKIEPCICSSATSLSPTVPEVFPPTTMTVLAARLTKPFAAFTESVVLTSCRWCALAQPCHSRLGRAHAVSNERNMTSAST
jgi:hypothetical protein